jgi:hypothetical protein
MAQNNPEESRFFEAVGRCIASWQIVELEAFDLYCAFMEGADSRLISVSFYHIQSFDSRIQLLDRCALFAVLDEELARRWKGIKKDLDSKSQTRNKIVHSMFYRRSEAAGGNIEIAPSVANVFNIKTEKVNKPENNFDFAKLVETGASFHELADDIMDFRDDYRSWRDKSP